MQELENSIRDYFMVSPEDCKTIAGLFKSETIKKNAFWCQTGRPCDKMSFVQDGIFRLYADHPSGREITQWIAVNGSFLTDVSAFMLKSTCTFNIRALTTCKIFTIDRKHYETLGNLVPRWSEIEKLFISRCFVTMEKRVFDLISLSAEERYKQLFSYNRELFNQVPLQYLASMLGMTPETLSRIRRKLIS